jgi:hypothetical protein
VGIFLIILNEAVVIASEAVKQYPNGAYTLLAGMTER